MGSTFENEIDCGIDFSKGDRLWDRFFKMGSIVGSIFQNRIGVGSMWDQMFNRELTEANREWDRCSRGIDYFDVDRLC